MKHVNARTLQIGLVVLAAVALLGWLRQPVRPPVTSTPAAAERPTFAPPPAVEAAAPVVDREYLPQHFTVSKSAARPVRVAKSAPVTKQRIARNGEPLREVRAEAGRHELPPAERVPDAPEQAVDEEPRATASTREDDERTRPIATPSRRSGKKSAMIIGGAAAAGAAIGGATGGGKGAAIGAIAGGLGGFVYDRMTAKNFNAASR